MPLKVSQRNETYFGNSEVVNMHLGNCAAYAHTIVIAKSAASPHKILKGGGRGYAR